MDKNTLIILKTDLNAQLKLIQSISQKLNERANGLNADDIIRLESVAYQIHNLYNATEDFVTFFVMLMEPTSNMHNSKLILIKL